MVCFLVTYHSKPEALPWLFILHNYMDLTPHLDRAEVGDYVKRHLEYAGADHDIFSENAIDEIFKFSGGAARMVNKVCTHCLLYGAQNKRRIIDDHMVKLVIQGELV